MKRIVIICLAALLLAGCGQKEPAAPQVQMDQRAEAAPTAEPPAATETPRVETVVVAPAAEAPTAEPTAEPALAEAESLVNRLVTAWESAGFLEGLFPYTAEDALDYYGIDFSACRGGAAFAESSGYTCEAVVLEADGQILDQAESLLQSHLDAVKAQFRSYDADALALAEKAVLLREGDVVLFLISPNAEQMTAVFRDLTK